MLRRIVVPKPVKGGGTSGYRGADDVPTVNSAPGGYPKIGSGTSSSETPRLGQSGDEATTYKPPVINEGDAMYSPNSQGSGSASTSTNLCTGNRKACDAMKDVAEELVNQIIDAITDAAEPETSSAGVEPTATATAATGARNASTVAPTPMPNLNMSSWMDLYDYRNLFTEDEFNMLQDDPLCFYANLGRLYEDYASSASRTSSAGTAQESSTVTTITTSAPVKRTAQPRPRDDSNSFPGNDYAEDGNTPDDEDEAQTLYLSYLPDQLRLVYTSTPTSLTVTATATTTCSGLSGLGMSAFETPYVVFGYREGYDPSETTASVGGAATTEVTSAGASARGEGSMPLTGLAMLGVLWLARLI